MLVFEWVVVKLCVDQVDYQYDDDGIGKCYDFFVYWKWFGGWNSGCGVVKYCYFYQCLDQQFVEQDQVGQIVIYDQMCKGLQ